MNNLKISNRVNKKNLFIILILAVIALAIWLIFGSNNNQGQNNNNQPPIDYVYQLSDFPDTDMDEESTQNLVDRLNNDYGYLHQADDYDVYDLWIEIGNLKLGLMDFEGAVEAWKYDTVLNPINPLAFSNLGNYYKSFARDYDQAAYYFDLSINKDNIGYYHYYVSYADLYETYLPAESYRVETIMLDGMSKPAGQSDVNFYQYLYYFFKDKQLDANKAEYYKNKILELDPEHTF
ncbi:MAG: hypothetical protein COV55_01085 [Candidatus Komeilibacteria bacterium CG11_big_fil_rev_8_21_14_0_20_36_20]|uniref:Uncharacterized protein n=1 Tax=Candidatus Komeilibacteria bacterium CG11_big_fil_rev_8_21_14_0_20_36_20 TaxID=1974477 RepID=A0A2H0NDM9_9BACT|nr:MAG: hypothetical protein COV55_01085 [Candidatus Komeilibacteria bacterium CG11_big_fil_rev_8_21_14_0_20_36_20]PIR81374.1 MAG: hypothetical protein COU21_04055 [Candidatus Komeilibacteria bacterium CG10_big_fil_rev_8_21_14_0_10_36_65]PJC55004.1 MAG: hypothetical protein CO027_04725 [Candidatus Komeilibacteria bacterium CG_4_9_14_0_2_um_filter_36_13]